MNLNKIENRKTIEKNQWNEQLGLWEDNNIDKPLARLSRKKYEKTKISNLKNERGNLNTDCSDIKIKENYEQLYANKHGDWDEMGKFLEITTALPGRKWFPE